MYVHVCVRVSMYAYVCMYQCWRPDAEHSAKTCGLEDGGREKECDDSEEALEVEERGEEREETVEERGGEDESFSSADERVSDRVSWERVSTSPGLDRHTTKGLVRPRTDSGADHSIPHSTRCR